MHADRTCDLGSRRQRDGLADGSLRFACGAEMLKNLADRTFVMLLLKKAE